MVSNKGGMNGALGNGRAVFYEEELRAWSLELRPAPQSARLPFPVPYPPATRLRRVIPFPNFFRVSEWERLRLRQIHN